MYFTILSVYYLLKLVQIYKNKFIEYTTQTLLRLNRIVIQINLLGAISRYN